MIYVYEALVYPSESGDTYEVYFPDWDAYTFGDDYKDAVYMANDLLKLMIYGSIEDGFSMPEARYDHEVPKGARLVGIVVDDRDLEPEPECMDVAHAAEILGVTVGRVHAMLKSGILTGHKEGNLWMIDVQSVKDRVNNPRRGGRPRRNAGMADVQADSQNTSAQEA